MSSQFVLVVHEDSNLRDGIRVAMSDDGIECRTVSTVAAAFEAIQRRAPDTVILGLDQFGDRGIEICRRIRTQTRTPLVAVSTVHSQQFKVRALDEGADDFIEAPFSMPELMARVRVALRHRREMSMPADETVIVIGDLRIDPSGHAAAIGQRVLALTPKEFQLLALLAKQSNRVVAREAILGAIWPNSRSFDTLRLHVSQLRKKLTQSVGAPTIVTEPGVGYRLSDSGRNVEQR